MDKKKIERAVKMIIEAIGEDLSREGLSQTPNRVARMYEEIFSGIGKNAAKELSTFFTQETGDFILIRDIEFHSMCEHHLLPFFGRVHVAYIPGDKGIVGLSKLGRAVEVLSRRPQVQERFTEEISDLLESELGAQGVAVVVEATHLCMTMRGVRKVNTMTLTSSWRGSFQQNKTLREEFWQMLNPRENG